MRSYWCKFGCFTSMMKLAITYIFFIIQNTPTFKFNFVYHCRKNYEPRSLIPFHVIGSFIYSRIIKTAGINIQAYFMCKICIKTSEVLFYLSDQYICISIRQYIIVMNYLFLRITYPEVSIRYLRYPRWRRSNNQSAHGISRRFLPSQYSTILDPASRIIIPQGTKPSSSPEFQILRVDTSAKLSRKLFQLKEHSWWALDFEQVWRWHKRGSCNEKRI